MTAIVAVEEEEEEVGRVCEPPGIACSLTGDGFLLSFSWGLGIHALGLCVQLVMRRGARE